MAAVALLLATTAASALAGYIVSIAEPDVLEINPHLHPGKPAGPRAIRTKSGGGVEAASGADASPSLRRLATPPIMYHAGGAVMAGLPVINVYFIYYGAWADTSGMALLESFTSNIGASTWWAINRLYTNSAGASVGTNVVLAGTTLVGTPYGTSITNATISTVLTSVLNAGTFPVDDNGIYMFLTSSDVINSTSVIERSPPPHPHPSASRLPCCHRNIVLWYYF